MNYRYIAKEIRRICILLFLVCGLIGIILAYLSDEGKIYGQRGHNGSNVTLVENIPDITVCDTQPSGDPSSIAVETDKTTYAPLQEVTIFIYVYDGNGCPVSSKVALEISQIGTEMGKVYKQSFYSPVGNGETFTDLQKFGLDQSGRYNVSASTIINGSEEKAWKTIQYKEIYSSRHAFMWFVGAAFFSALIILIVKGVNSPLLSEIFRFIFISGIIFSVLLSFIFINEEVSAYAPVGVVIKRPEPPAPLVTDLITNGEGISSEDQTFEEETTTFFGDGEWVINIGGQPPYYKNGIQIPINVLIFGIAGGYLRYLYKTSRLHLQHNSEKESSGNRITMFYQSLEDISLLFLAPLLAIAVWFLLSQAGIEGEDAINTVAVVSFTVGLITEEVIQALIRFASSALRTKEKQEQRTK